MAATLAAEITDDIQNAYHYGSVALITAAPGHGVFAETRRALAEIAGSEPLIVIDSHEEIPAGNISILIDLSFINDLNTQSGVKRIADMLIKSEAPAAVFAPAGFSIPAAVADLLTVNKDDYTPSV